MEVELYNLENLMLTVSWDIYLKINVTPVTVHAVRENLCRAHVRDVDLIGRRSCAYLRSRSAIIRDRVACTSNVQAIVHDFTRRFENVQKKTQTSTRYVMIGNPSVDRSYTGV